MFLTIVGFIPTAPEMGDEEEWEEERVFFFRENFDSACKISKNSWAGNIGTAMF